MAEKNLIGELDMYREAGIKPNFSDIAKRYGKDRHTVAAYWRAEGGRPRDGRADRAGSFDAHIEEVAAKAQLPGVIGASWATPTAAAGTGRSAC